MLKAKSVKWLDPTKPKQKQNPKEIKALDQPIGKKITLVSHLWQGFAILHTYKNH